MKAELREKKVGSKTGYLKYWVPEADRICEISLAKNKFKKGDDGEWELTKNGKEAAQQHLEQMVEDPEQARVKKHEQEMDFDPSNR